MKTTQVAWLCSIVFSGTVFPAYAVSEGYRKDLDRSHTTQVQDAHSFNKQKTHTYRGQGVIVRRTGDQVYIDGKAAILDESSTTVEVYSSGLNHILFYKKGRISLITDGTYVGDLTQN